MTTKQLILSSIKPVIETSKFVSINHENIPRLAGKLKNLPLPAWDNALQFSGTEEQTAHYYFFVDSINFCFWAPKNQERWSCPYGGKWISGYYAFSLAIKNALIANPKLWDAGFLSQIPFEEFEEIFEGRGQLLLMPERHRIIQENFQVLNDKFAGAASKLIESTGNDADALVQKLLADFPTFRDIAEVNNQPVYLLKRAQLLCADINQALQNQGLGYFKNLQNLAVFADYKLPQLLEAEKVIEYSPDLLAKISSEELLEANSREEIEIRTNTVWACELILAELKKMGREITSSHLDWLLWVLAKQTEFALPHHKTLSTFY